MVFTLPEVCTRNSFARVARSLVTTSRVWAGFSEPLLITRTILGLLHLRREFMVMRTSGHLRDRIEKAAQWHAGSSRYQVRARSAPFNSVQFAVKYGDRCRISPAHRRSLSKD